jgi:tripartite-type tricarboxylate transporter receptor subunit TctC
MNRTAVICIAIAGAMAGTSACAAETYPTKPVRMIVPSIAGGNADIQARYIAERLSEALGKQFVVDNRGGASGIIGVELAARSPADGYTVMLVANTFTVAPSLFPKLPSTRSGISSRSRWSARHPCSSSATRRSPRTA